MQISEPIKDYLYGADVMQLATVRDGQPWICSVYFVLHEHNLYWLSLPSRRHSQEAVMNDKVAVAVAVKPDMPVIGIQMEGAVSEVDDAETVEAVMAKYVEKYDAGHDFHDNFRSSTNQHHMYRFMPTGIVLFDEVNFAGNPRQVSDL